ncbi:MAG: YkgJ family cysteine cluster protein [Spirochaetaceae bacterium]|nr:MAG: YkgJ family cysteine cluster protein [Spirochaetaceae bacterium]
MYARFDRQAVRWAAKVGVSCPTGCGRCCAVTVPPCSGAEAQLIALHLIETRHPRLEAILNRDPDGIDAGPPCPFYDASSEYHCTIYEVRPLVCRAFGYASVTDKARTPVYRLCEHMPVPQSFAGSRVLPVRGASQIAMPPTVGDVQARIDGLSATLATQSPIDRAVRSELHRILIARGYARDEAPASCVAPQISRPEDDPDPELTDPLPPFGAGARSA